MDCQRCGACCTTERGIDAHVDATPQESVLIPEEMLHKKAAHGLIPLRTKTNKQGVQVCIALDGVVGGRVRCSIYANRPGWKSRYTSFVNRGDTGTHEGYVGDIGIRFIRRMGKSKVWCMVVFLVKDETTLAKKNVEFWFEIPEVFNEAMEMLNARQ